MLASEVINAYEAFCPQEFQWRETVVACKLALWTRRSKVSWLLWIFREETVAEAIEKGVDLIIVKPRADFPSHQGFGS